MRENPYSALQPPPAAQFDAVAIDGKDVAIIQVERSPSLVLANTGAYRRVGASVVAMSASMIAQMLQDSVHTVTETDKHLPDKVPDVIVGEAVLVEEGDTLTATGTVTGDPIAIGIANITTEVAHLKAQLAETTGWQAQWENYLIGGVVGAVISLVFTNGAGAVVVVMGVAAIVIIRLVRSRRSKANKN